MDSYNLYLYHQRQSRGMKMRAFAKTLGIRLFRYYLIENGYIKPRKKDIAGISAALEIDYQPHTEGVSSYPAEKDEIRKTFLKIFNFIGSKAFKIVVLVLCVMCLSATVTSEIVRHHYIDNPRLFYPASYNELFDRISEKGEPSLSVSGSLTRPVIFISDDDRYISLKGDYNDDNISQLSLKTVYWTDSYRCIIRLLSVTDGSANFEINLFDYQTKQDLYAVYDTGKGQLFGESMQAYQDTVVGYIDCFFDDFDRMVRDKLDMDVSVREILAQTAGALESADSAKTVTQILSFVTLIAGLGLLFILLYAHIYGTKNGVERNFSRRIEIYPATGRLPKRDIRFFPFIPETVFEIIGIVLLGIASLRFQLYLVVAFLPSGLGYSVGEIKELYRIFMLFFYAGMFLLYFIDFDLFLDDKRVLRNICSYSLIFIGLYLIEISFLSMLNSESILFQVIEFRLPNMFGTITMYFLIIYLLYFTPKFVNTKKRMLFFRLLSVVPVLVIIGTYIIFNGAKTAFGWDMPDWAYYLFASERIPFSMLCVSYLYGVYFLRMYFRKKYGDEAAVQYFNGNRFLFMKNILICVIVLIIALLDNEIAKIPGAKTWGFGYAGLSVYLIPLLLFYHPHKGPRNRIVDYIVMALYILAITGVLSFLFIELI